MSRIPPLAREAAHGRVEELLHQVEAEWGMVPNLMRTLAQSPAALEAYLSLSGALARGALTPQLQEQIALAAAEANRCDYCLAAHLAMAKTVGLSEEEIADSRRGESTNRRTGTALRFVQRVIQRRGAIDDNEVTRLRDAGYSNAEIAEVVAHIGLNLFTNYFNRAAGTEVDLPAAPALAPA
ncbi:MAG: carboxymuconolactone decarboxylase family protein [Pirellulales bacterium]|nr:carboxymuconolactone decarboxylase family protein [Pirellulales bacterium]